MDNLRVSPMDTLGERSPSVDQGYLEGLLKEREALINSNGMESARRLISQGKQY